jgi:hypothetical protein
MRSATEIHIGKNESFHHGLPAAAG